MSSRTNITLFGLLWTALLPACVDDAVVGTSGQINVALPQATLGEFAADSSTAIADVDGDGFGDLVVWTNAVLPLPEDLVYDSDGPRIGVYVFLGGEARFPAQLDQADADVRLTLQENEFVARVAGQDLDGDGKAELLVHVAVESTDNFPSVPTSRNGEAGSLYVLRGAALTPGVHALESIAEATPAYAYGREYVVHAPYAYRDLDGVAGAEFLTEPYRLTPTGVASINVRDVATGETRARLLAPELEYLDVRGVLDHDGDGSSDVAVTYVRLREELSDASPTDRASWGEVGIGIFYGPLTGDITLGDEGTQRFFIPLLFLARHESFVLGGAARTVVGDACGDETDDVVLPLEVPFCLVGGSREVVQSEALTRLHLGPPTFIESPLSWLMIARLEGQERSRLFSMGRDAFATSRAMFSAPGSGGMLEAGLLNRAELQSGEPGTPLFTHLGGAMGDLDGDGLLDVALGSQARGLQQGSFVHVVYGFGG